MYDFRLVSDDTFEFYISGELVLKFKGCSFRDVFESYAAGHGLSTNWVGSMLKIWHKKYPVVRTSVVRSDIDRLVSRIGVEGIAEYFRSQGWRVVKPMKIPEMELIKYMEKEGYVMEGFIDDVHYSTAENVSYIGRS